MWTAGETTGLAFGTTILAVVLAVSGYLESTAATAVQAQPTSAIFGIVMAFSLVPATLMALSYIPLFRYPLRKKDVDVPEAASVGS
jgi:Na+/melibiose symporter-like transporter